NLGNSLPIIDETLTMRRDNARHDCHNPRSASDSRFRDHLQTALESIGLHSTGQWKLLVWPNTSVRESVAPELLSLAQCAGWQPPGKPCTPSVQKFGPHHHSSGRRKGHHAAKVHQNPISRHAAPWRYDLPWLGQAFDAFPMARSSLMSACWAETDAESLRAFVMPGAFARWCDPAS